MILLIDSEKQLKSLLHASFARFILNKSASSSSFTFLIYSVLSVDSESIPASYSGTKTVPLLKSVFSCYCLRERLNVQYVHFFNFYLFEDELLKNFTRIFWRCWYKRADKVVRVCLRSSLTIAVYVIAVYTS